MTHNKTTTIIYGESFDDKLFDFFPPPSIIGDLVGFKVVCIVDGIIIVGNLFVVDIVGLGVLTAGVSDGILVNLVTVGIGLFDGL